MLRPSTAVLPAFLGRRGSYQKRREGPWSSAPRPVVRIHLHAGGGPPRASEENGSAAAMAGARGCETAGADSEQCRHVNCRKSAPAVSAAAASSERIHRAAGAQPRPAALSSPGPAAHLVCRLNHPLYRAGRWGQSRSSAAHISFHPGMRLSRLAGDSTPGVAQGARRSRRNSPEVSPP